MGSVVLFLGKKLYCCSQIIVSFLRLTSSTLVFTTLHITVVLKHHHQYTFSPFFRHLLPVQDYVRIIRKFAAHSTRHFDIRTNSISILHFCQSFSHFIFTNLFNLLFPPPPPFFPSHFLHLSAAQSTPSHRADLHDH